MKALIMSADNFEDSELLVPYYRVLEEGMEVVISSMVPGRIRGKHGYEVDARLAFTDVDAAGYGLLIIPGGKAPASIRREDAALGIVRAFFADNRPVAAICHGPQLLISAGVMGGRRATCYRSVAEEMKEAGALYEDREVVVDANLVTSRHPGDIPFFMRETMRLLGRCHGRG